MSQQRVLIVDFASEARTVPCGRDIAAALPHGPDVEIVRGTGMRDMAGPAGGGPEYGIVDLRPLGGAAQDPVLGAFGASGYSLYNAHFHEVYPARAVDALGLEALAAAGISRDIDGQPSRRRPEVYDALLKFDAATARARDAAE